MDGLVLQMNRTALVDEALGAVSWKTEQIEGSPPAIRIDSISSGLDEGIEIRVPLGQGEMRVAVAPHQGSRLAGADVTRLTPEARLAADVE